MSTLLEQVYRTLATGQTLSGEALAQGLGVTRSAVWKAIETLRGLGLSIEAQTQRGYRLSSPVQPLDAATLRTAALNMLRLAGFQSVRGGMQAVMHDITALLAMARRRPQPIPY